MWTNCSFIVLNFIIFYVSTDADTELKDFAHVDDKKKRNMFEDFLKSKKKTIHSAKKN